MRLKCLPVIMYRIQHIEIEYNRIALMNCTEQQTSTAMT